MDLPDPVETARALVLERYSTARQAWLGGSVYAGQTTATSDLDITVLLSRTEVHRESVTYRGWPVELFVHTDASARHFVEKDRARRRPTMARLVVRSHQLLPGQSGAELRAYCEQVLDEGPPPLTEAELQLARYTLTDLVDDLVGGGSPLIVDAIAVEAWRSAAELLLSAERRWVGGGKGLIREIEAFDADEGTEWAAKFHAALSSAVMGSPDALILLVDEVLDRVGGRLRDGLYLSAVLPPPNEQPPA